MTIPSTMIQVANLEFDSSGLTGMGWIASANAFAMRANGVNVFHSSVDRTVVSNMTVNSAITIITPNNPAPISIQSLGGTVTVNGTMNILGSLSTSSVINIAGNNISVSSESGIMPTWQLINSITFSAVANVFTPNLSGWKMLRFHFFNIGVTIDGSVLALQPSTDNCDTFATSGNRYEIWSGEDGFFASNGTIGISLGRSAKGSTIGNAAADGGVDITLTLMNYGTTGNVVYHMMQNAANTNAFLRGSVVFGQLPGTTGGAIYNSFRFAAAPSGAANTVSGTMYIEGIK